MDIEQKAERVRQIVNANFGTVRDRNGDIMHVELPSDLSIAAPWGQIGLVACVTGQRTGMAERRVTAMNGATVVCNGDFVTQAYFTLRVRLVPPKPQDAF